MKKKVFLNNISKFMKSYNECIAYNYFIEDSNDLISIFNVARNNNLLRQYNESVFFCNAKTNYMGKDAILSFFVVGVNGEYKDLDISTQLIEITDVMETILNVEAKVVKKVINKNNNSYVGLLKIISNPV